MTVRALYSGIVEPRTRVLRVHFSRLDFSPRPGITTIGREPIGHRARVKRTAVRHMYDEREICLVRFIEV